VAGLAVRPLRRVCARRGRFEVWILEKSDAEVGMTPPAGIAANKGAGVPRRGRLRPELGREWNHGGTEQNQL
jgi:hypothetical protein